MSYKRIYDKSWNTRLSRKLDRLSLEGKAAYAKVFHDLTAVIDSIGLCVFSTFGLGLPDYVDMYNAVCGDIYDADSLLEAGERVWNLEKLFKSKRRNR